ncbi:Rrf2 family transcriptional regulator [Neobittarella massiliensis]|uniref:Rrf2 family transcriptional regulator n=2 Tax=Oscillospiraceae TaxID=216572 RepID=A0A8J6IP72_9FIRM|nr:Rrf2 family transcriptional regulator [Neobittarella massiliensis]MBC3516477.1 Rrf2 family transcriptional regulator [Neobittarella massiliensis]SCJ88336.1 HTH-type transcriptional repressor NsrR [uncultured Anaerotruncus sp.]
MVFTRETDYAVRIVRHLATVTSRTEAKKIAEATDVTLRFALKILSKLVAGGLVRSYKGTQGGYELQKPAAEISLRDIVEIIEGPVTISKCLDQNSDCECQSAGNCKVRRVFGKIADSVNAQLASYTIDQFADD